MNKFDAILGRLRANDNAIQFGTKIEAHSNLLISHVSKWTDVEAAADVNITTVKDTIAVGSICTFRQVGAGQIVFVQGADTTISGNLKSAGIGSLCSIVCTEANKFVTINTIP